MYRRHVWMLAPVAVALLIAACGPEMITPTAPSESAPAVAESTQVQEEESTTEPEPTANLQADEDDWHVLGSADAPVTIVEYSDFQ
jgi:protein-disulfide isomerase